MRQQNSNSSTISNPTSEMKINVMNALSKETAYKLFDALVEAQRELDDQFTMEQLFLNGELYDHFWILQQAAFRKVRQDDLNETAGKN
ncbi:MAG: hypothetical protein IJ552_07610 [Prevotella sp.]|nr:hypothetical protein [Prevotella sp.]